MEPDLPAGVIVRLLQILDLPSETRLREHPPDQPCAGQQLGSTHWRFRKRVADNYTSTWTAYQPETSREGVVTFLPACLGPAEMQQLQHLSALPTCDIGEHWGRAFVVCEQTGGVSWPTED